MHSQIAAVCDFYMFVGHIQKGIIKSDGESQLSEAPTCVASLSQESCKAVTVHLTSHQASKLSEASTYIASLVRGVLIAVQLTSHEALQLFEAPTYVYTYIAKLVPVVIAVHLTSHDGSLVCDQTSQESWRSSTGSQLLFCHSINHFTC